MTTRYRLGIDAGGTFTDFLLVGSDGSRLAGGFSHVVLDPPRAGATGLAEMAEGLGVTPSELAASIDTIVHGTTVATNAVLTRNGAVGGVLCTEGFRDTLDLGDGDVVVVVSKAVSRVEGRFVDLATVEPSARVHGCVP